MQVNSSFNQSLFGSPPSRIELTQRRGSDPWAVSLGQNDHIVASAKNMSVKMISELNSTSAPRSITESHKDDTNCSFYEVNFAI